MKHDCDYYSSEYHKNYAKSKIYLIVSHLGTKSGQSSTVFLIIHLRKAFGASFVSRARIIDIRAVFR